MLFNTSTIGVTEVLGRCHQELEGRQLAETLARWHLAECEDRLRVQNEADTKLYTVASLEALWQDS